MCTQRAHQDIFSMLQSCEYFLVPTRITSSTVNCLDYIYTNTVPSNESIINKQTSDCCGQLTTFNSNSKNTKNDITCVPINNDPVQVYRSNVMLS